MSWTKRLLEQGAASGVEMQRKIGNMTKAFRAYRSDGWANLTTGVNTSADKTAGMVPYLEILLSPQILEALYHGSDAAARIVSAVPDEVFREPWSVINKGATSGDPGQIHEQASDLENDLDVLGCRQKMREALTWGRLYGLGAILIGADDGQPPDQPLDIKRVKRVHYLTVLDKRDLVPWQWYTDPRQPKFGDIAVYQVQPVGVYMGAPYGNAQASGGQIIMVHESRLIRFGGELTSKRERLRNQGADFSVLQKCYRALQLVENNWQGASTLLADASQGVFKIEGLMDMITQQPDVMQQRMMLVDQLRSTIQALVLDTNESFERMPSQFTGIPQMLEQTWYRLAMAARMPLTILMGMSPGGLNATGDSDLRWWYDTIAATQRDAVLPQLDRLLAILAQARGYDDPQDWSVKFAPLWQMKASEKADMELKAAQRDQIYLQEGVLYPEDVALSRFGEQRWSDETIINIDARKAMLAIREEQELEKIEAPPPPLPTPGAYGPGLPPPNDADPESPDPGPPPAATA